MKDCFSSPGPAAAGTLCGVLAVLFWSMTAPVIALATGVNPFLYVGMEQLIGFALLSGKWFVTKENPLPELKKIPPWFVLAGMAGIGVHNLTWVAALHSAPPLEATTIIYLWPLLVVVFTSVALKQRLRWYHALGCALGFCGIALMMTGRGLSFDHFTILPGHLWAIVCALSWSVFSALSARHKNLGTNGLGLVFLANGIIGLLIWVFILGVPPAPARSLLIVSAASLFIMSGYILWDIGMKRGNTRLIGIVSFLTPVLAAFYLVLIGKAEMTGTLAGALALTMLGIAAAKYGEKISWPKRPSA